MLSLRDFFHLPQVDPLIDQITHESTGLILVVGMDLLDHIDPLQYIPSGRMGIFRIMVRQILEQNPKLSTSVIAKSRNVLRVPHSLRRRVSFELIDLTTGYNELIPAITQLHPGLLVVDQLSPENAALVLAAAHDGALVITQIDTVFRGVEITSTLHEWGVPDDHLCGLRWVITVQRIPKLCECKRAMLPEPSVVEAIHRHYPNLEIDTEHEYYVPGVCEECEYTGRHNEITAFDFYQADRDRSLTDSSVLPLEAYILSLAEQGIIPLKDLLHIESDQRQRTYQLLTASELALAETRSILDRKILELETANRVLQNRTAELVSLQEIGQALIGSKSLRDLARQVCRQASQLCGADRAVFYFLGGDDTADVLATHGWAPGSVPLQIKAQDVCNPAAGPVPTPFNNWPPGIKPRHPDVEGASLKAGLRIPLVAQGHPVGAMIVHTTSHVHFHPGAIALMQTFANQAAIAIQRAGLIENLQEKIVQLESAQVGLAQKERLVRELELAREVQQAVLPHTFPEIPGFHFAAHNQPARQVGGDFYDVIDLGAGCFGLVVADVSDKGMPAAVYMALTRSLMVAEARRESSPVAVLQNVNELLRELGRARMFVTVFYGVVDSRSRKLIYARAGHDRPLLLRGSDVLELSGDGVLLGFHSGEHLHLTEESLELNPADRLILYTDGLIDTISPDGTRFDRGGLYTLLKDVGHLPANELCDAVFNALIEYQGTAEQFDDMTLLVVEVDTHIPISSPMERREDRSRIRLDEE